VSLPTSVSEQVLIGQVLIGQVLIGQNHGTDGVSAPTGRCVKIWLIYPPTPENLRRLLGTEGQGTNRIRIGLSLEGGITLKTTSAQAIYLPAGCIHATLTIEGGYLAAVDFTTMGSVKAFSRCITSGLDRFLGA
jgi:hypothetical protein